MTAKFILPLEAVLENLIACFGDGPDSDEFWEAHIDNASCDCTNPEHPHTEAQIREYTLQAAREWLAEFRAMRPAKFGRHLDSCAFTPADRDGPATPCTCGWQVARALLAAHASA